MISARRLTLRTASETTTQHVLRGKTARTLLCFIVCALLPHYVPSLSHYRLPAPAHVLSLFQPAQAVAPTPPVNASNAVCPQPQASPGAIEDPSGQALQHFFKALQSVETSGGQARISHYGDSPITNDGITATVRRKLQTRFGDAGHGFILAAKPWGWYQHDGVAHEARGWLSDSLWFTRGDQLFGYGGVSFSASAPNAYASFSTVTEGEHGRSVAGFDVYYLAQPKGSEFIIELDGAQHARVATADATLHSVFHRVNVAPGAHTLTLKPVGNGAVRLFGVVLDSGERGVQYDSLGVNGAFIGLLARYINEQHWSEQLRQRRPDLVILAYGANESEYEDWPMEQYEQDTREVVRRIRAALPEVSLLFVAPMDRGKRGAGGAIITRPTIPKLVAAQRKLAAETGCAFFDTFTAMGGEGTVARWREARPRLMGGDYLHPTAEGTEIVGTLLYDALLQAYEQFKPNHQPLTTDH
jgi:lysophospholipase L1-like esterase